MDGCFSMEPIGLFQQLYAINADIGEHAVALVFALLERKTVETYEELFRVLRGEMARRGYFATLTRVSVDFVIAVHTNILQIFPNIVIDGCFSHLTQSTHRKVL